MATCNKTYQYRWSMYHPPESRPCGKDSGHDGRCGQKPKKSKNPTGTCQACFRKQKVLGSVLAHHGYQRPGWGYQTPSCLGARALPYEQSCEITKVMLQVVENYIQEKAEEIDLLKEGPETITYVAEAFIGWENTNRKAGGYATFEQLIHKGDDEREFDTGYEKKYRAGPQAYLGHVPSYDQALKLLQRKAEDELRGAVQQAGFLRGKISSWKLAELTV